MRSPWIAVILLAVAHLSLTWSLDAAGWAEGLHLSSYAVILGVLIGTLLAFTPWPAWWIRVYTLLTGSAVTLYLTASLVPTNLPHYYRAVIVIRHLQTWLQGVVVSSPQGDNLVFVLDIVFLLWWLSILSTVELIRHRRVWTATLPTGVILVLNTYYAPKNLNSYLLVYLGATLILFVVVHLDERITLWEHAHVRYPLDVTLDFLRNGILVTLVIIALAWGTPALARSERVQNWLSPVRTPWHRVQEEWGRVFSTLHYEGPVVVPVFTYRFHFQGAPELHDTPLFRVRSPQGYYWRAAVYDVYEGDGWRIQSAHSVELYPSQGVHIPPWPKGEWVTQTVTTLVPGVISLIGAPTPIHFSIPIRALVETTPQKVGEEIYLAQSIVPLRAGETYTVVSQIVFPQASELRAAGTDYPSWVKQRFLQLPPTLPNRVRELAHDLTASHDNPYDKALALERYLRSIPYSESIPAPPAKKDAVDWFLFEEKRGYCDYYASSMAIMARAVGIPARIASGYARGVYDEETGTWTVRERDAHTWPELYFPGYGWIPFEPTAGEPPLTRPEPSIPADEEQLRDLHELDRELQFPENMAEAKPTRLARSRWRKFWLQFQERHLGTWVWIIGVLVSGYLLGRTLEHRWKRHPNLIPRMYKNILWWERHLGLAPQPSYTPNEHAQRLARLLPIHRAAVANIMRAYQIYAYGPPSEREALKHWQPLLYTEWKHLLPALGITWMRRAWHRLTFRLPKGITGQEG